jgi:hypothetical protein
MRSIRTALGRLAYHAQILVALLAIGTSARAQQAPTGPTTQGEPDWVISYTLVSLCIALGLFVVCRMGKRSHEIRRTLR